MKNNKLYVISICLLLVAFAIGINADSVEVPVKYDASIDVSNVVKGNTAFACELYQEVKGIEGNLFFSPYSISTALAMTYGGARGETEKEMAKVLHFGADQDVFHKAAGNLQHRINSLQSKGKIQMAVANSLWGQKNYPFLDPFINLNEKYYGAGLELVDFVKKTEESRKKINEWVETKTNDKIKELIGEGVLNPRTRLVLVNAIYFKGDWADQFKKQATRDNDFYLSNDKSIKVPMMSQTSEFKWIARDDLRLLELPYAGKDVSMVILLPEDRNGIAKMEKELTKKNIDKWLSDLSKTQKSRIHVQLPKFKTEWKLGLSKTLIKMGMKKAFGMGADFSGMEKKKELYISAVIHQAYVDVNEKGTEAAAATAVVMAFKSAPAKPDIFRVDHPFVFLIKDNTTGSILFIGRIMDPTK